MFGAVKIKKVKTLLSGIDITVSIRDGKFSTLTRKERD